jgi:7,8-dihydro-6-hydroxymethylpterin dimethyltransferase
MPQQPSAQTAQCRFCGANLKLLEHAISARCMVCGERGRTRTWCSAGHFVCEGCRGTELMGLLEAMLEAPRTTDPVQTFLALRESQDFPMNGPEHHPLVAAAFLLAYYDQHGEPSWEDITDALQTAATELPGGSCGFWGACSAGLAVGIAYCAILGSSPTDGGPRSVAHQAVSRILGRIGEFAGPRCCRRDCLLALQVGCELSAELLPHPVRTSYRDACDQAADNDECLGGVCPFLSAEG